MQHVYTLLFISLLFLMEVEAINDGLRVGRKVQTRDKISAMTEEEDAEAPKSSIAPEDTENSTNQTFNCSEQLEHYLREANLTRFSEVPCNRRELRDADEVPTGGGQECRVTHNRKFKVPQGQLITVVHTPSARICCELCRGVRECYSWWRRYSDGHCHLNSVFTRGVYSSNAAGGAL